MFTGIIEEVGHVVSAQRNAQAMRLTIAGDVIFSDMKIGDSIAVNGVCLTVTSFAGKQFVADVMPESVNMTTFSKFTSGQPVNLERAMASNGRFGGHMVAGHVDGQGRIRQIRKLDNSVVFTIETTPDVLDYIIYKALSPLTERVLLFLNESARILKFYHSSHHRQYCIANAKVGTVVNLETDIAGRYIRHFMTLDKEPSSGSEAGNASRATGEAKQESKSFSKDWLMSKGFI